MPRTPRTVVLLPPSEGKAPGGDGPAWDPGSGAFGALARARKEVVRELLRAARSGELLGALDGTEPHRRAAVAIDKAVKTCPTLPALQRYSGVLCSFLDAPSLPKAARARADGFVHVSGLAGLAAGADPLPDYSLPIGLRLPALGGLAAWWKPHLSPVLDDHVRDAVVWDLLPGAHASAWKDGGTYAQRWRVRVLSEAPDGKRTTVSHDNKSTKGLLARELAREPVAGPAGLSAWAKANGLLVEVDGGRVDVVRLPR